MKQRLTELLFPDVQVVNYVTALAHIRNAIPDLILLTEQPGQSSLLMLSKIHRQFPLVPVVMVATDVHQQTVREHIDAGAADYIYYVGAEREMLSYVVEHNLENRLNVAASEESLAMFRQLERDQKSGFRVQQAMLPNSPLSINGLEFNHQLYPSMIMSGDFIDYFGLFDGRVAFYIADVSGHGASSAFITVLLKSLSRKLLDEFRHFGSTAEILSWINSELLQWELEQHVTMFFGIIDGENNRLEYSNAAHYPGTILCDQEGASFLATGGQPLGLYSEPVFDAHQVNLPEHYAIVMFSDGVFEILPQTSLEAKEAHLLSVVKCHPDVEDSTLVDELVETLGVLSTGDIPDDIAVFTVSSADRTGKVYG